MSWERNSLFMHVVIVGLLFERVVRSDSSSVTTTIHCLLCARRRIDSVSEDRSRSHVADSSCSPCSQDVDLTRCGVVGVAEDPHAALSSSSTGQRNACDVQQQQQQQQQHVWRATSTSPCWRLVTLQSSRSGTG
jgi:hypothetical protein